MYLLSLNLYSFKKIKAVLEGVRHLMITFTTSDGYVYLHESNFNIGQSNDTNSFDEAVSCSDNDNSVTVMEAKLKSIHDNDVWDLVDLLGNFESIGCKWGFKTKRDLRCNIDPFKARPVAKGLLNMQDWLQWYIFTNF